MKSFLIFLIPLFFICSLDAQELSTKKSNQFFLEWNFGLAYITDVGTSHFIFPGTSLLLGKTWVNENNYVFEFEAGLALPSIVTGKIGVGKKINNSIVVMGVRPYPFHLFLQSSIASGEKGYWITSMELNPLQTGAQSMSLYSKAILNFGYRWNLSKKKQ
jgi:hypothetical protein